MYIRSLYTVTTEVPETLVPWQRFHFKAIITVNVLKTISKVFYESSIVIFEFPKIYCPILENQLSIFWRHIYPNSNFYNSANNDMEDLVRYSSYRSIPGELLQPKNQWILLINNQSLLSYILCLWIARFNSVVAPSPIE